jgi:hypothetical protein
MVSFKVADDLKIQFILPASLPSTAVVPVTVVAKPYVFYTQIQTDQH